MEREPKPKYMLIEIFGKRLECTPENTYAYLYEDTRFDHLFYVTEHHDNGSMAGYHIWRTMLDDCFDDTIHHMIDNGYEVESLYEPVDTDKDAFFKRYPNQPYELPKMIEPVELTPRQNKFVESYGKFLQLIEVTAEDFLK